MPQSNSKNVLRVFEHQKLLLEKGGAFKQAHWKALSRYNEKYGRRYFTILHNGVKFSSYVGAIQAGRLTIEILPKIDKEKLDSDEEKSRWHNLLLQMIQLCQSVRVHKVGKANLQLKSDSILNVYIQIFLQEVEELLHQGLIKTYRKQSANTSALKGKLDIRQHIRLNQIHKQRFFVQHPVYDKTNILNQLIHEALKIVPSLNISAKLKNRLSSLQLAFSELPPLEVTPEAFKRVRFTRKSMYYKPAIELAKMLLLNYRPDLTGGANNVIAILFDMNTLWEEYIFRKLQSLQTDSLKIGYQQSRHFWKKDNHPYPNSVQPDIVIQQEDRIIILDTKWKLMPHFKPSGEDLRQMFVYNLYWRCNHSILLYPGAQYQRHPGAYFNFHPNELPANICAVATCNILDENNQLDAEIGRKILSQLCGLS